MRVLIVDDEPIQRNIIKKYCETLGVFSAIFEARDGVQALTVLDSQPIDLLLCDIEMPLLNGLGLVSGMRAKPAVIFITAYPDFAVNAFDLDVVDYLLKPVLFERFVKAVQKVKPVSAGQDDKRDLETSILIKAGSAVHKIVRDDLCYIETKGNYTLFHFLNKKSLNVYQPLVRVMESIPEAYFTQVHRSFVVNNRHVLSIESNRILVHETWIPIGRSYRSNIEKLLP